ncbi:MAG: MMPL family transporter [Actinomycetaceae bacterium]|nr:MMPL family transporter [Actinomycetaceae bacterium]
MFQLLARAVAARPRVVILSWAVFVVLCLLAALTGFGGKGLWDSMSSAAPHVPQSESSKGQELLDVKTDYPITLLVQNIAVDTHLEDLGRSITAARLDLGKLPGISKEGGVVDPFLFGTDPTDPSAQMLMGQLLSHDRHSFIMTAYLDLTQVVGAQDEARERVESAMAQIPKDLASFAPGVSGIVTDQNLMNKAIDDQIRNDLLLSESILIPLVLIILIMVFGGILASGIPLVSAVVCISFTLGVVYLLALLFDVQSFVVSVVTIIGLGLAIEYALIIVSRYREELLRSEADKGGIEDSEDKIRPRRRSRKLLRDEQYYDALEITLMTAGRTVTLSALAIAIMVSSLAIFSPQVLKSIGLGGSAVVLLAALCALTLIPALLILAKERMLRPPVLMRLKIFTRLAYWMKDTSEDRGLLSLIAPAVQKKPWAYALGSLLILSILSVPALGIHLRSSTNEYIPQASSQGKFLEVTSKDFPEGVALPDAYLLAKASPENAQKFVSSILTGAEATGLARALNDSYSVVELSFLKAAPGSPEAVALIQKIRQAKAPFELLVTGQAATQLDFTQALADGFPWVFLILAVVAIVVIFLVTGSAVIPILALLINALSVLASLGIATWIIQGGHLQGLFNFESLGGMEAYAVAVTCCFAFVLAMDYGILLLTRMKEAWDESNSNTSAVTLGLLRSERISSAVAVIVALVYFSFVAGDLLAIKQIALSLAFLVLLDATVVRMVFLPATMYLFGRANWWAPKPLGAWHKKLRELVV